MTAVVAPYQQPLSSAHTAFIINAQPALYLATIRSVAVTGKPTLAYPRPQRKSRGLGARLAAVHASGRRWDSNLMCRLGLVTPGVSPDLLQQDAVGSPSPALRS